MDDPRRAAREWLARELVLGTDWIPRRPVGTLSAMVEPPEPTATAQGESEPLSSSQPRPTAPDPRETTKLASADAAPAPPPGRAVVQMPEELTEPAIRQAVSLDSLRDVLGDCDRCKLCNGRQNIVFGAGNPNADLMFVGEGPGEDEDREGVPFVGRAGQLLTDIIVKGMRLRREDVYIANVVKCRPPGNRDPQPDEIAACEQFLARQVELVAPRIIVTLGKFASHVLLRSRTPITRMRGQWHQYGATPVMPTFHPAYLLRNPSGKREVWEDVKAILAKLAEGQADPQ